ncbi:hypothetical protein BFP72_17985 [Reichenbachiella sp. 5M10]|nr:hypothetical protein BFP72_17985 [Reichenbachiella sp. 5M10]
MVAPGLNFNQVHYQNTDDTHVNKKGLPFRAKFGLEFEFPITETYAFATGLIYAPKKLEIKSSGFNEGTSEMINQTEEYKLQYLQLPVTLKLYTSEIQPDLKVFFQLGFMGEILLHSQDVEAGNVMIDEFRFFDVSFTGGAGVEYGAGVNTLIYGGVFYDRGLVNVVKNQNNDITEDLVIRTDMLYLKIGLKF